MFGPPERWFSRKINESTFNFIFRSVPILSVIRLVLIITMTCVTYLALLAVFGSFKLSFRDKRSVNRS